MVLLAAAYALIEEGPVDQLLWNDSYAGADLLHSPRYIWHTSCTRRLDYRLSRPGWWQRA